MQPPRFPNVDNIADRIRLEMESRGWGQNQLGREAEVSRSTISDFMTARTRMRADVLAKILKALGKTWAWLDEPMPSR